MIDCIIGSSETVLKISAHGRWDAGVISIRDIERNLSNIDVVLYRRHSDIYVDFLLKIFVEAYNKKYDKCVSSSV